LIRARKDNFCHIVFAHERVAFSPSKRSVDR
jgi:hypothetical protein